MAFSIRPYQAMQDGPAVYHLYQEIFAAFWPIRYEHFRQVISEHAFYREGDHFVAEVNGEIAGFAVTQVQRPERLPQGLGGIALLFVAPAWRKRGIGRALHQAALEHLRLSKMKAVCLGGGGLLRFWPGIPDNLPSTQGFFEKMGWSDFSPCCDLVRHLSAFEIPASLRQRMDQEGIDLHPAQPDEIPAVLDFENREFTHWYREFAYKAALGECNDILAAWDEREGLVGTLMMFSPQSKILSVNLVWKELLGLNLGGMGAVGVAQKQRGRGIGLALVNWASAVLKQRGVGNALIDWTGLVDFYAKAGYMPWQRYQTSFREI